MKCFSKFQLIKPLLRQKNSIKFTNVNKDDTFNLDKWHIFEEANPTAFVGMYQFWCQKISKVVS